MGQGNTLNSPPIRAACAHRPVSPQSLPASGGRKGAQPCTAKSSSPWMAQRSQKQSFPTCRSWPSALPPASPCSPLANRRSPPRLPLACAPNGSSPTRGQFEEMTVQQMDVERRAETRDQVIDRLSEELHRYLENKARQLRDQGIDRVRRPLRPSGRGDHRAGQRTGCRRDRNDHSRAHWPGAHRLRQRHQPRNQRSRLPSPRRPPAGLKH